MANFITLNNRLKSLVLAINGVSGDDMDDIAETPALYSCSAAPYMAT